MPQGKNLENAPSKLLISVPPGHDTDVKNAVAVKIDPSIVVEINSHTKFIEDSVEFLRNKRVATRIACPSEIVYQSIVTGRQKRGWRNPDSIEVGNKAETGSTARRYANSIFAKEKGLRHSYRICPIEGGNMLTGTDFIIVGKDALYATMGVFSVDDTEAKALIGYDFGIAPEHVYPVEQPGEYHLDMSMLLLTDQVVLLKQETDCQKKALIDQTICDLRRYGFIVIVDLIFVGPTHNFLNGEFIVGADGKKVFLTNAPFVPNSELEETFRQTINDILAAHGFAPIQVEFIQDSLSLRDKAGLACRMKGIGV